LFLLQEFTETELFTKLLESEQLSHFIKLVAKLCFTGLGMVIVLCSGCASDGMRKIDAGPLYVSDNDIDGSARVRSLGPFIETQKRDDGMEFFAVRPFYCKVSDPAKDRSVANVLWPFGMIKELKGERDWIFFPSLGHNFDLQDNSSRSRWSLFPILFGGRDALGRKYFSIFPLGGTLHEFFGADRIIFALFPLFSYTEHDDNRIWRILWPIFVYGKGDDEFKFRVFPFYGVSVNDKRWKKRFVMWPFWSSVKYLYPDQKGGGFILFPLFGKIDVGDYYSRMLFPPFFKWEVGSHGHRALNCPWPFIRYKTGDIKMLYLWPLWGRKNTLGIDRQWFALWPLISGKKTLRPEYVLRNFRALPFVFYESKTQRSTAGAPARHGPSALLSAFGADAAERGQKAAEASIEGDVTSRYFKIWPLVSYWRDGNVTRLRALALWPAKYTPAVERCWAPLWSIFVWRRHGQDVDGEILWGMLRWKHSPEKRSLSIFPLWQSSRVEGDEAQAGGHKWSLFYGLLGYERKGLQKQLKLLYLLKFGKLDTER
jgi:hypothetical protein